MEYSNNWCSFAPRSSNLRPDIGPFQRPRGKQHKKLTSLIQGMQNAFLEIFAHSDVSLVKESFRTTRFDLLGNPLCYPRISSGMTDEYEPRSLSLLWLVMCQRLILL